METRVDKWGYKVRTSSGACLTAINSYYDQVLNYGRRRSIILDAISADPSCALANALAAHFIASKDPNKANQLIVTATAAAAENATDYEKAVVRALTFLVGNHMDVDAALDQHSKLLKDFPKDLISLKRAQVICFYIGRPDISLSLVEMVLAENYNQSYIHGMHAFPLLELGRMDEAERTARRGLELKRDDVWSQHALCHVLQYKCHFQEAVSFMEACASTWNDCSSFMYSHNWWHVAVCYLEGHASQQKVADAYGNIWKELERSHADPGEVYLNALGLLMRIYVRVEIGFVKDWIISNHLKKVAMILTDEGEKDKAEKLLDSMRLRVQKMSKKQQQVMQKGIMLGEAIHEYGRGNYLKAFDILGPDFNAIGYKMIGASDEQLDVFNEVWYIILLNTGHVSKAIEEIDNEIKRRERAPFLWRLLEKAYFLEGKDTYPVTERANFLEATNFS